MNKRLTALILTCALLLTACTDGGTDEARGTTAAVTASAGTDSETKPEAQTSPGTEPASDTAPQSSPQSTENTDTEATEGTGASSADIESVVQELYGPGMDKISAEEITDLQKDEEGEWSNLTCDGFVYLAEPTGVCFNSIDNADKFDSVNVVFEGTEPSKAVYKRYKVGDSICGLTITEAESRFLNSKYAMTQTSHAEKNFGGGRAVFEGSSELTGYLIILTDDEYGVGGVDDVIFIPDSKSQTLPILNYSRISDDKGVYSDRAEFCCLLSGFGYQSEYPFIHLGNISDYSSTMFSLIEKNTPTKAKVNIDNIIMSSNIDWFATISAHAENIDVL